MSKINGFIDIHTHILPYIDDGSNSVKETVQMFQQAYDEGIRYIICTPHFGFWNPGYDPNVAEDVYSKIKGALAQSKPDMTLEFGNEIFYTQGIVNDVIHGKAKTLAGTSYVLLEFNPSDTYEKLEQGVREFTQHGYIPILAHIERYQCLKHDINRVYQLNGLGAYMQINAGSLLIDNAGFSMDKNVKSKKQTFEFICDLAIDGMIHFVASDCHNISSRRPRMKSLVNIMKDSVGTDVAKELFITNPISLIRNRRINNRGL